MLEPTTRALFTDALRPPANATIDLAVGTTYTLSLNTLLIPPLAMAAHDHETTGDHETTDDDDATTPDTLAMLESVRRYADRTTVYCHAGAIAVPGKYRRILTFAEDSVLQVLPRTPGSTFHPKVWALRFLRDGDYVHRLIVSSRNLTDDRSWDTLLVLDEGEARHGIEGASAAEFIRALPSLAVQPPPPPRTQQARDLASTLASAWFELPPPFTAGTLCPLGVGTPAAWPMPEYATRALVVSPFLDAPTTTRVRSRIRPVFVSRPETFALLGARALAGKDVRVLSPHAESHLPGQQEDDAPPATPSEVRSGLHAKVLVWDQGRTGHLFTGSANATSAAFGGNVEFGVLLSGPRRSCGVEALLPPGEPSRDQITFGQILEPHTIADAEPHEDPLIKVERDVEYFHASLLQAAPTLTVEPNHDGDYAVSLSFAKALPTSPGWTRARLLSRARSERMPLNEARWSAVPLLQITPYLEVLTRVEVDGASQPLEVACAVKAHLVGAPEERGAEVLRSYLNSEESIVRYLRFLLDDAGSDTAWEDSGLTDGASSSAIEPRFENLAILEPLLRAAAQGSESLERVHALLRDLGVDRDETGVVPPEFLYLWEAVWSAARAEANL